MGRTVSPVFISTKRAAFHILLAKLRAESTLSVEKRRSPPMRTPTARLKRSASAPYSSMTSSGSMPLPSDLLILRPLRVAHEAVDAHKVERLLPHALEAGHDHARHPEEDDVVACHKYVRRVEVFELGRLLRPAQRGERPQAAGKPRIQHVLVLRNLCAAAPRALLRHLHRDGHLAAVAAVVRRDAVPPPQLARDTPVADVLHPVEIYRLAALWARI